MIGLRQHILQPVRFATLCVSLAALAACSSFGPSVTVSQTQGRTVPAVTASRDAEDDVIGAREHPRIIASYGGVYQDRKAEVMLARIVGRLLTAAAKPAGRRWLCANPLPPPLLLPPPHPPLELPLLMWSACVEPNAPGALTTAARLILPRPDAP